MIRYRRYSNLRYVVPAYYVPVCMQAGNLFVNLRLLLLLVRSPHAGTVPGTVLRTVHHTVVLVGLTLPISLLNFIIFASVRIWFQNIDGE